MPLVLTDDFNRADSATLGGSWVEGPCGFASQGFLEIVSNELKIVGGTFEQFAYWSAVQGSDISVACKISGGALFVDYDTVPLAVEVADTTNGYEFYVRNGVPSVAVYRKTVSDSTISLSATFARYDGIGIRCYDNGSTVAFEVWKRTADAGAWAMTGSGNAATRIAGPYYPGAGIYNNTSRTLDDFRTATGAGAFDETGSLSLVDFTAYPRIPLRTES